MCATGLHSGIRQEIRANNQLKIKQIQARLPLCNEQVQ
jgi:hypothetical protein